MKPDEQVKNTRTAKQFRFNGFGFPVIIEDCPMIEALGEWVPNINFIALEGVMAIGVALKPYRLTGAEIHFLRLHFELNLQELADHLGVTRQAVAKWEKAGQAATEMAWATEKDIRLLSLSKLGAKPEQFQQAYERLQPKPRSQTKKHRVQASEIDGKTRVFKRHLRALKSKSQSGHIGAA